MKPFLLPILFAVALLSACNPLMPEELTVEPSPTALQEQDPKVVDAPAYTSGALQEYSSTAYAEALRDGKTVILDFHANWCPVCRQNAPHIKKAFEGSQQQTVVGFIVNYDTETTLLEQFGVSMQSTLVKVRGSEPARAEKIDAIGPGPLTQEQVSSFIQS